MLKWNRLKKRIWQSDEKLSQVKYHLPIWPKRPDSSPALCQRHFLHLTHFTIFVNTKFVDRFRAIIYCHLFHRCYITGWAEQDEIFLPKLWNSIGGHTLDNKKYNIINSIVKRGKSISWYNGRLDETSFFNIYFLIKIWSFFQFHFNKKRPSLYTFATFNAYRLNSE